MTSEGLEASQSLESKSPSHRATAAQWLLQHPQAISARVLMNALQAETVPQVRRLLLQVMELRQAQGGSLRNDSRVERGSGSPESVPTRQVGGSVDVAALVRHELSPAVGWIRLAADDEIDSFASSRTNDAIRKLQRRIDGLVAIIKSNEDLNLQRLSLPHVLMDNWPDSRLVPDITSVGNEQIVEIETDEGLFSMLLSNVYQNAIDAAGGTEQVTGTRIVWGCTDQNFWVRVTNPFNGNRFDLIDVVDVGSSSKKAHQGRGLSLIQTVAERLGYSISLGGVSGIASFTLTGRRPND
ncbi:GHKL domain-containing protein [Rathayibacter sp. SD072]|uniref:GHKL domain-containing protein n=1 Tax=Rathayibacter sp. SD072 TaxID=2781731 RepID=UPI001A95ED19|nr:GHKL domain-containing protein [Rathayibacter sp. SD072]MBO0985273.1 HAMP domain-containing histidine kinase [Rathayibacter sp. SD072]